MIRSLAWATDIHLDHLADTEALVEFARALIADDPDAVLITGDISVAGRLEVDLEALLEQVDRPLFFVLGNHDFYGSDLTGVRARVMALCDREPRLTYLGEDIVVPLSDHTALVGVDGWGDARCGDVEGSPVRLSDFVLIQDLAHHTRSELVADLRRLGDIEAERARSLLDDAAPNFSTVVFATHVPPFLEACWYEGEVPGVDDPWAPYFVCVAVGEVLRDAARRFPDCSFEVYCGHSHGAGRTQILDNLIVHVGAAEYGRPRVDRVLKLR